jgi:hypothetical protein
MFYNEGSLHNIIREKNKIDTILSIFVLFLVLTLHVSALILVHHQAYSDTSLSSWIARNFNMDPYCVVSFKCIN